MKRGMAGLTPQSEGIRPFLFPIIAGVAATGLIISLFSVVPGVLSGRDTLAKAQAEHRELTTKAQALANIDESAQSETLRAALTALPISLPYQQALALLGQLSETRRIGMTSLKVTEGTSALLLQFDATGGLPDLTDFLTDFETVLPIASLQTIDMTKTASETDTDAGPYRVSLIARINWQRPPETIGKPRDPLPVLSGKLLELRESLKNYKQVSTRLPGATSEIPPERASTLFAP